LVQDPVRSPIANEVSVAAGAGTALKPSLRTIASNAAAAALTLVALAPHAILGHAASCSDIFESPIEALLILADKSSSAAIESKMDASSAPPAQGPTRLAAAALFCALRAQLALAAVAAARSAKITSSPTTSPPISPVSLATSLLSSVNQSDATCSLSFAQGDAIRDERPAPHQSGHCDLAALELWRSLPSARRAVSLLRRWHGHRRAAALDDLAAELEEMRQVCLDDALISVLK